MMFDAYACKSIIDNRGYRKYKLAQDLGITPNHLSRVINGWCSPSDKLIRKFAEVLMVPVASIIIDVPEVTQENIEFVASTATSATMPMSELPAGTISSTTVDKLQSTDDATILDDNSFVLDALRVLKVVCSQHRDCCLKCPLCRRDGICGVTSTDPVNYNIVTSTHWTAFRV